MAKMECERGTTKGAKNRRRGAAKAEESGLRSFGSFTSAFCSFFVGVIESELCYNIHGDINTITNPGPCSNSTSHKHNASGLTSHSTHAVIARIPFLPWIPLHHRRWEWEWEWELEWGIDACRKEEPEPDSRRGWFDFPNADNRLEFEFDKPFVTFVSIARSTVWKGARKRERT
jgi:hypothetical protein